MSRVNRRAIPPSPPRMQDRPGRWKLLWRNQRRRLRSAIDALATEDREVVDAVYDFDDLGDSGAELARRRGVSRSHVSRAHLRILETLRGVLSEASA